jgi:hypothetical protein
MAAIEPMKIAESQSVIPSAIAGNPKMPEEIAPATAARPMDR